MMDEQETRIKLKTSFQDSYLEDRGREERGREDGLAQQLKEQIREAELELELQKATHQYLVKQIGRKPKLPKEALEATVR